jgi:hypothetical protein
MESIELRAWVLVVPENSDPAPTRALVMLSARAPRSPMLDRPSWLVIVDDWDSPPNMVTRPWMKV